MLAMGGLAGCSTTSLGNGVGPPALAACPSTVADADGSRCTVEGLSCAPTYSCGSIEAFATCVCAGGQFVCTDVTGMPLHAGSTPSCPDAAASEACPASETSASLAACTEPGRICTYPSTCRLRGFDTCQCVSGELDNRMTGLRFQCSDACNVPDATPDGDAADAADGADATDAADGGDAPDHMIDADAAGADGTQVDGAPSDSSTADITAQ
jgi:hypothetical protein